MIDRLRISNFKAWRESGVLAFAPITLLLGSNSSGKSAFIQSLLLCKKAQNNDLSTASDLSSSFHIAADGSTADCLEISLIQGGNNEVSFRFVRNASSQSVPLLPASLRDDLDHLQHLSAMRSLHPAQVQLLVHDAGLRVQVARCLQRMGIVDDLTTQPGDTTTLIAHKFGRQTPVSATGTGLAMALPVIMAICQAAPGSVLMIEEPEVHLHPLAQSALTELIVEVCLTRRVQLIMETHSEHMFRRLQTLIARGTWHSDKTAAYFIELETDGPSLRPLTFDPDGRLLNWPAGFFGDALADTREQARLILSRMKTRNL